MKGGEIMKNKIIITTAILTIVGASLLSAAPTYAQTPANPITSLIERIAQRFGLNKTDVQKVFDDFHQEKQNQMIANFETKLNQLVKDGKITESQKTLILQKQKELAANRQQEMQDMKNKTPEERRAAMNAKKQELENWAKQNGIDLQYLFPFGKGVGMHGFGMKGREMWKNQ